MACDVGLNGASHEPSYRYCLHSHLCCHTAPSAKSLRRGPCTPHRRASRRRSGDLGHAGRQLRPDAAGDARQDERQGEPGHLLGSPARLDEPDADAQPRRALLHGVLQHQGRADRARPPAGRRQRIVQRQHCHDLADAARGRRPARLRQGRWCKVSDPSAGLCGHKAGRLRRAAIRHVRRLHAVPREPQEPRRCRCRRRRSPTASG